mgnify:CR=1 FL=1
MNTLEQLEAGARKICDAVEGRTTGRVQVEVKVHSGGLVTVQFYASVGEICGAGKDLYRSELGDSVEHVTDALLNTITRDGINKSIRVKYLEDMAKELGFELKRKRGAA